MNSSLSENPDGRRIERVIYAWNYLTWGGAQVYFLGLAKETVKHFEINILLPLGSDPQLVKFFTDEGFKCDFFEPALVVPAGNSLVSKARLHAGKIASERSMLRALDDLYDLDRSIVHVEISPWQSLMSLIWLSLRTQVFITMHNSLPSVNPLRKFLWKLKLRVISNFKNFHAFASNKDARSFFKDFYTPEFYKRLPVTYTNVNPDEIGAASNSEADLSALRLEHGIPKDAFVVICVAQFIDRKGRWVFLDAAKKVIAEDPGIHFVWVSNSILNDADARRVESYRLGKNFQLIASEDVGSDHVDLFKFIRAADVFVLASFQEGLPISLLEGMALGVPCVSTRINAIPEAIENDVTGLLVEAGDADGLADAIRRLKNDPAARKRIASAGRKIALEGFNEKTVAKIALEAYFEAADVKS